MHSTKLLIKYFKKFYLKFFLFSRRCRWHRWTTSIRDYLREFSKKNEMVLLGYSGARGTQIYEKNLKAKVSCQTPFKTFPHGKHISQRQVGRGGGGCLPPSSKTPQEKIWNLSKSKFYVEKQVLLMELLRPLVHETDEGWHCKNTSYWSAFVDIHPQIKIILLMQGALDKKLQRT